MQHCLWHSCKACACSYRQFNKCMQIHGQQIWQTCASCVKAASRLCIAQNRTPDQGEDAHLHCVIQSGQVPGTRWDRRCQHSRRSPILSGLLATQHVFCNVNPCKCGDTSAGIITSCCVSRPVMYLMSHRPQRLPCM